MFAWLKKSLARQEKKIQLDSLLPNAHSTIRKLQSTISLKDAATTCLDENRLTDALLMYQQIVEFDNKDVSGYVGLAYVLQQLKRFDEAEINLAIVLNLKPDDPDALYMMGKISAAGSDPCRAVRYFEKLLKVAPQFEIAYTDFAFLLFRAKEIEEAIDILDQGLHYFPENADFYLARGNLYLEKKIFDLAVLNFEKVVLLVPNSIEALSKLGATHFLRQDWSAALHSYRCVLEIDVKNVAALINLGKIFFQQKKYDEAIMNFNDVIHLMPSCVDGWRNKAITLREKNLLDQALVSFDRALEFAVESADLWSDKSALLLSMKRFGEALSSAERAMTLDEENLNAMINKSAALFGLGRFYEAMPLLEKILKITQENETAFWLFAKGHQYFGRHELALSSFTAALKLKPDLDSAHFDEGFSYLTLGNFSLGWKKYEYRWKCAPHLMENRNFKTPYWDGKSSLAGKTLLIFYEAGYGDTIQFVRYFKMFAGLGCKLIFQTQPPLKKLLSNFDPNVLVVAAHETLPAFDTQIALMSLPLVFNTTLETIPTEEKYLDAEHALPGVVSRWREKILNNERKKIGLVWSGNPVHQQDTSRSISSEQFLRLVSDEFYFACLQKDIRPVDRSFLVLEKRVVEFSADLTDFVETAGLITNMDLVITVDTSIAHLAGALGKPVWVLLPFNADWRWLLNRSDSPWYPSMTLFRQKEIGNWDQVLDEVSARLKELR